MHESTRAGCKSTSQHSRFHPGSVGVRGIDSRQLHPKWLARAISPGEVSFPINHTWPSQAAFAWGEVVIYYIDHLPQVEEFSEHT